VHKLNCKQINLSNNRQSFDYSDANDKGNTRNTMLAETIHIEYLGFEPTFSSNQYQIIYLFIAKQKQLKFRVLLISSAITTIR